MAGFWSNLLDTFRPHSGTDFFMPRVTHLSGAEVSALVDPSGLSAVEMWESQPHFRTVIAFVARNMAQLGLHAFVRDGEDRRRDRDSVLADSLACVDGTMTTYDLVFALAGDLMLYDRAYWYVGRSSATSSGWMIRRLPPTWVDAKWETPWDVKDYRVWMGSGKYATVPAKNVLAFTGYHPSDPRRGSPTVDALRETLSEQVEAAKYRAQVWKRGGRVSAVLERPANAAPWSAAAREAFREDWYAKYTGQGSHAGGTPILEDGMNLRRIDFSAQDQQYVEAAKLSLQTVASAFHVNPTMIGMNDGANYSNVREFRKMLYGDTLGPLLAQVEDRLNTFLIPMLELDNKRRYVEFNIEEKLQGNFEEQSNALSASTGAPWMTRNEARALRNLTALPGGDALVTPLNVLIGGQGPPRDSGSQNRRSVSPGGMKAEATTPRVNQAAGVFKNHFARQRRVILSALGAKAPDWWDSQRWNDDLSDDIYALAVTASKDVAEDVLDSIGFGPDAYDSDQTLKFLRKLAERIAGQVNATTLTQLKAALDDDEDPDEAVRHVFDVAEESRADDSGRTLATAVAGFATVEAGKQAGGDQTWKRWTVNSGNPRPSHAAMDGEEVPIDDPFSNGLDFPGDYSDDAGEVAGCSCSAEVFVR